MERFPPSAYRESLSRVERERRPVFAKAFFLRWVPTAAATLTSGGVGFAAAGPVAGIAVAITVACAFVYCELRLESAYEVWKHDQHAVVDCASENSRIVGERDAARAELARFLVTEEARVQHARTLLRCARTECNDRLMGRQKSSVADAIKLRTRVELLFARVLNDHPHDRGDAWWRETETKAQSLRVAEVVLGPLVVDLDKALDALSINAIRSDFSHEVRFDPPATSP